MSDYQELTDAQWFRLKPHLPFGSKGKRGRNANNRLFINALLWMARSGGRWRDLPSRFGKYDSVKRRYYLWVEAGVLEALFEALREHGDQEWLMMDATIVRAHAQAAGARHKKGGSDAHALGRSKGGLTTKIHGLSDALGLPLRLIATPGQRNDITQAEALLEGFEADYVLADKGYDGKRAIEAANKAGAIPVIPSRKGSKQPRQIDAELYKERNIIERFFGYLKQFRRVATRYDKHIQNYMGFIQIAAISIWIKSLILHYSLVQEQLFGTQYFVNAVSIDGKHFISEIWKDLRSHTQDYRVVSDREILLDGSGKTQQIICDYVRDVLTALEIENGASHTELMLTDRGPVLIETAARMQGTILPKAVEEALGYSHPSVLVDSVTNPNEFSCSFVQPYKRDKHLNVVTLISRHEGCITCSHLPNLLNQLDSFIGVIHTPKEGDYLRKTIDLFTNPGTIYLCSDDEEVLESDYKQIREWEADGKFFDLE